MESAGSVAALYDEPVVPAQDGLHVVAHLGQSLDGKIATANGQSTYVTGHGDLVHMHRLRATSDVVVVGGGTVFHDDPQLTVRLCPGRSPWRAIIDPKRRLGADYRVFRNADERTLLLTFPENVGDSGHGRATVLPIERADDGNYCPRSVLAALAKQGLRRVMIEGGGSTVARFWRHGCLDRLDLCIAPVIIGQGRDALPLPSATCMEETERFEPERFTLGHDMLYVLRRKRQCLAGSGQEQQVVMTNLHRARTALAPAPP
ncbi:MAG TPA: RibD family protein [Geminicoccus sp.]|jgi:riboflavin-specific deaminase-like protein|uniref:RibD family protein n=1 Tax=Geminicoccus sp. TaxID=2024832 RepID=UPI002E360347|nr:RibD family protein [Geminicoccus sp.]HEX2526306.1 RibD family protein [Geminicoccus sp.]